ncbi:hypothetical protein BGZ79_004319, partial [Entomortierella chlamydospora]
MLDCGRNQLWVNIGCFDLWFVIGLHPHIAHAVRRNPINLRLIKPNYSFSISLSPVFVLESEFQSRLLLRFCQCQTEILNCICQPVIRSGLALSWIRSKRIHVRSTNPTQPADPTQPAGLTRWVRILFIDPTEPPDRIQIKVKSGQIRSVKISSVRDVISE